LQYEYANTGNSESLPIQHLTTSVKEVMYARFRRRVAYCGVVDVNCGLGCRLVSRVDCEKHDKNRMSDSRMY